MKAIRAGETTAMLFLCSAYLYGGMVKAADLAGAIGEMQHFGVPLPRAAALAAIVTELVAPLMVLTGAWRWIGALWLAAFTVAATVIANPFWSAVAADRLMQTNIFLEHLGLAGAFALVALRDVASRNRTTH